MCVCVEGGSVRSAVVKCYIVTQCVHGLNHEVGVAGMEPLSVSGT